MIRFYSIFVTDDTLLASPYVRRFNLFHDLTLHLGIPETVNFLLQAPLTPQQLSQLNVLFDPNQLTIVQIDVKSFKYQSLITAVVIPKELGSVRIGFAFPQTKQLHQDRLRTINSPLTSVLCSALLKPDAVPARRSANLVNQ